jgi:predicted nuclease of predicted toxin-antitoxin system
MRFLADECVLGEVVRQLRKEGHDVATLPKHLEGASDSAILGHSYSESRILLTQDYDFGELAVRLRMPTIGIVIVAEVSFTGSVEEIAARVVRRLGQLGDELIGMLTIRRRNARGLANSRVPAEANNAKARPAQSLSEPGDVHARHPRPSRDDRPRL